MKFRVFLADGYGWKKEIIVQADTPDCAAQKAREQEPNAFVKKVKAIRA